MTTKHIACAVTAAAFLLFAADQAPTQPSSDVTADKPPPSAGSQPPTGPGLSRLPLIDPKVFPPGGFGTRQDKPAGEPGASSTGPGHAGGTTGDSTPRPR